MLRTRSRLEEELGMWYYYTEWPGVGGRIRERLEDFVVEEVLRGGVVVGVDEPVRVGGSGWGYTWVHVVKRGVDTLAVARALARAAGVGLGDVGFGGFKDARAVAAQVFSVPGSAEVPRSMLGGRVSVLSVWGMGRGVSPGDVEGNRFRVVVRGVSGDPGPLGCVPNYFGHQRFGTVRPVTHLLGEALARRDPGEFIYVMFCVSFPGESGRARRVRELACSGDYVSALAEAPRSMREERAVLSRLLRFGDAYVAVARLPRVLKLLYLEAYQSRLFNELLSRRMEIGALDEPVEGDLVAVLDEAGLPTRHVIDVDRRNLPTVARLVRAGRAAVVVTVPGPGARLPRNLRGSVDLPSLDASWLGVRLRGDYRLACVRPRGFSWVRRGDVAESSFFLPRGSYATVLLREVMKPGDPAAAGY